MTLLLSLGVILQLHGISLKEAIKNIATNDKILLIKTLKTLDILQNSLNRNPKTPIKINQSTDKIES
jgi:hypothetical protein